MRPLNQTHPQSKVAHNRMTQTIDRAILCSPIVKKVSNSTCEAYGCHNSATNQVTVNVGRLGDIDLNLCNNCVPMFKNTDKLTASEQQLTYNRMANPDGISLSTA